MDLYGSWGKRVLDILFSLVALPFLGIAFVLVAPLIKLEDRGPVFYRSMRRGRRGRAFSMVKFRSMTVDAPDLRNADGSTVNSARDARVTKVGRILRKTSVDEIPQVLNVLRGDMSFVGPRPNMNGQAWEDLSAIEKRRVEIRPGLTGLSQAILRNAASTEAKYALDCYYVDHVTFTQDLRIVLKTIVSVLRAKNINSLPIAREEAA